MSGFPEVTIAVVGEENAGKTSFVKCALDMKNSPTSTRNKKKMSLDGSVYIVRLMEVDLMQVQFDQEKKIIWPHTGTDTSAPVIDGVLILHDATKPDRLSLTTSLISRFYELFVRGYMSFYRANTEIQRHWLRRICRSCRSRANVMLSPSLWKTLKWMRSTSDTKSTERRFPRRDLNVCA